MGAGARERAAEPYIATLIANTKRVRRPDDIVTVAKAIRNASGLLGSVAAVADRTGVSEEMLREFLAAERLAPAVRKLVRSRRIDSVDVAYRISLLPDDEQGPVAGAFMAGELTSDDVRAVVSFRRRAPGVGIAEALARVASSRNIKHYVAEFLLPTGARGPDVLRGRFAQAIGEANLCLFEVVGRVVRLVVNADGMRRLQALAKERGMTKRSLLKALAEDGGSDI
jgi:transcriptional regulator with XRE-family HTH domain